MAGNCDSSIYKVDSLTLDGVPLEIVDSSAEVEGLAGFENEVSNSASGDDAVKRKRVPRVIKAKLQLKDPKKGYDLKDVCTAQITLTDQHSGKRIMFAKASFKKLGNVGKEEVDIEFFGLGAPIFL